MSIPSVYFAILQRAQDLANVTSYREWVLFGYLVCPDELLRVTSIDIAMVYDLLVLDLLSQRDILMTASYLNSVKFLL